MVKLLDKTETPKLTTSSKIYGTLADFRRNWCISKSKGTFNRRSCKSHGRILTLEFWQKCLCYKTVSCKMRWKNIMRYGQGMVGYWRVPGPVLHRLIPSWSDMRKGTSTVGILLLLLLVIRLVFLEVTSLKLISTPHIFCCSGIFFFWPKYHKFTPFHFI